MKLNLYVMLIKGRSEIHVVFHPDVLCLQLHTGSDVKASSIGRNNARARIACCSASEVWRVGQIVDAGFYR